MKREVKELWIESATETILKLEYEAEEKKKSK